MRKFIFCIFLVSFSLPANTGLVVGSFWVIDTVERPVLLCWCMLPLWCMLPVGAFHVIPHVGFQAQHIFRVQYPPSAGVFHTCMVIRISEKVFVPWPLNSIFVRKGVQSVVVLVSTTAALLLNGEGREYRFILPCMLVSP